MKHWPVFKRRSPLAVRSAGRSHVGLVRLINEDRLFDCPTRGLWAVADGMGGHAGGDLAAQAVVDAFRDLAAAGDEIDAAAMLGAIEQANREIIAHNKAKSADAGSTVVALQLAGRRATIAWVGDSRAYLLRGKRLTQLTRDHSFVQDLIDAGLLTIAAAASHPRANVVTRALGVASDVEIATVSIELEAGDRLLLCSDGLSRSLGEMMSDPGGLDALADTMMAEALRRDGSDNITLICLETGE